MDHEPSDARRGGSSRRTWALLGFAAVAAYLLFSEHRAHAVAWLPYAILLACPLLHLFHGHGGHGGHGSGRHGGHTGAEPGVPRHDPGQSG